MLQEERVMPFERRVNDAGSDRAGRSHWMVACMVAVVALACNRALAEDPDLLTYGDPSVRATVDAELKKIYELANGPGEQIELITRDNPLQLKDELCTELSASIIDGSEARIVGTVWTKQGKYSFEFYRAGDRLLMVYETFSYFKESEPPNAWHNFMGLPAWESRVYFGAQDEVGYAERHGPQAPPPEMAGKKLRQQVERLSRLLRASPARWEKR